MTKGSLLKIVIDVMLMVCCLLLLVITAFISPVVNDYINPLYLTVFIAILSALLLGAYRATILVFCYLTMGALNIPILPHGQGGLSIFIGPMGGYLLGLIPCVMICGFVGGIPMHKQAMQIFKSCLFGYVVQLLLGSFLLYTMSNKLSLARALSIGFSAYIPLMVITCAFVTLCYWFIAISRLVQQWVFINNN